MIKNLGICIFIKFFVPWCRTSLMIKRKISFSFYRRKGAPNRTRFKEARLVAYASLQKFSKYTYYLDLEPKFLQSHYLITILWSESINKKFVLLLKQIKKFIILYSYKTK